MPQGLALDRLPAAVGCPCNDVPSVTSGHALPHHHCFLTVLLSSVGNATRGTQWAEGSRTSGQGTGLVWGAHNMPKWGWKPRPCSWHTWSLEASTQRHAPPEALSIDVARARAAGAEEHAGAVASSACVGMGRLLLKGRARPLPVSALPRGSSGLHPPRAVARETAHATRCPAGWAWACICLPWVRDHVGFVGTPHLHGYMQSTPTTPDLTLKPLTNATEIATNTAPPTKTSWTPDWTGMACTCTARGLRA